MKQTIGNNISAFFSTYFFCVVVICCNSSASSFFRINVALQEQVYIFIFTIIYFLVNGICIVPDYGCCIFVNIHFNLSQGKAWALSSSISTLWLVYGSLIGLNQIINVIMSTFFFINIYCIIYRCNMQLHQQLLLYYQCCLAGLLLNLHIPVLSCQLHLHCYWYITCVLFLIIAVCMWLYVHYPWIEIRMWLPTLRKQNNLSLALTNLLGF